ncbi:hypothetical protein O181_038251 [Austropuccinia psidii MF-1]|uniref:Uncharacterized protein n=1 Tax=Austropuccinia psidii MF-1 TaxID=1389203 RepID=A0A9Q3HBH2_9BASI|nr:hypothetical protein [Austropuccinia psidii MF-1]
MHPVLKVAGVVYIWYYIPLCTIFAQQFNGDAFRTKFHDPKIQRPFWRRTLQLFSLAIHGRYQKTIQGPQPPGPAGVGLAIISGLSQGPFLEVIHNSISCQGSKYFNTLSTTQLVHTVSNQLYLYVLGPIRPIHILLWEFNNTVQLSRWPKLYWPNSDNTASDSPSRISPSAFHIYWPPFITWGLFPQLINILDFFLSSFSFHFIKVNTDILGSVICTILLCLSVDIGGHIIY